jgi:hypothetical protein
LLQGVDEPAHYSGDLQNVPTIADPSLAVKMKLFSQRPVGASEAPEHALDDVQLTRCADGRRWLAEVTVAF